MQITDYRGTFEHGTILYISLMFHLLHTYHPSSVLATVGPFELRWYGLLIALGAALGYGVTYWLAKRYHANQDQIVSLYLYGTIIGFTGGRLYHVLNEPAYYWDHPGEILAVWHGGLAIHGAILAGGATIWTYCRRKQLPFWRITDLFAPAVILGQAVGRWGNYFNQELFGRSTSLPWGIPIDPINRTVGTTAMYYHPTFLYESLWDLLAFAVLLVLHRRQLRHGGTNRSGMITMIYFLLYGLGRLGVEFLRIDDVPLVAGIRLPLLVSGLIVLLALAGFWYRKRTVGTEITLSHDAQPRTD